MEELVVYEIALILKHAVVKIISEVFPFSIDQKSVKVTIWEFSVCLFDMVVAGRGRADQLQHSSISPR
jgi:hypothetical protein